MQITSATSLDTFLAPRPLSQAAAGNGDNASFARLMQQRQDQAVPAPQPAPRAPAADTSDATYDMPTRQAASTSDAKASTRDGSTSTSTSTNQGSTAQATADTKSVTSRRAAAARLDKPTESGSRIVKTDSASTTEPIKTDDTTPGMTPAEWVAQWGGPPPKQAPIVEPADGAADTTVDTAAANPVATTGRTIPADTAPIIVAGGGKQPTIAVAGAPNDPRTPVATPVAADTNPISLAPTADTGVKADKPAAGLATDDPSALAMAQQSVMAAESAKKDEKASAPGPASNDAAVGAAAAVSGTSTTPSHANEVTKLEIATPVHAPEFKEALGVQVSMMARDGVQHAELHLNPADMGPISVQIATEGTQARVDFGADSAATRQILEAGLPELASALQSAGLTLTGGGVSQHAQGGSQGGSDSRDESRGSRTVTVGVDGTSTLGTATIARTQRGNLDLYA